MPDSNGNDADREDFKSLNTKETTGIAFRFCFSDDSDLTDFRHKYYHFVNGRRLRIIDRNSQQSLKQGFENYMSLRKVMDYIHGTKTSILEFPQSHTVEITADYFDPLKDIYGDELERMQRKQYNEDYEKIDYWSRKIDRLIYLKERERHSTE